mgnify:CR=1 FL=1
MPPSRKDTASNRAKGGWNTTATAIASAPPTDSHRISPRRSIRSDAQPIGYCRTRPPRYITPMNSAIWRTDSPASVPQTEAMPNMAEKMPPVSSIPAQPSGEMRRSRPMGSDRVASNTGAWVTVSRIGVKASDTRTDGMTNSRNPDGSPAASSACEEMIPSICTIM